MIILWSYAIYIDDFEYIELDDLHKMNMTKYDIKKVSTINSKILD